MTLRNTRFYLLPALILVASASHGEGLYLGGGAVLRHYDLSQPGAAPGGTDSGYSLSGKLLAGYDFNDSWAFEAGYANFGKPSYSYTLGGSDARLAVGGRAWFGAAKASMALSPQFSLLGKIGVDRHRLEVTGSGAAAALTQNQSKTSIYVAGGLQYKINQNLATTLEIEHFGSEARPGSTLTGLSANLKVNF